jgi:hypothetical protein
MGAGVLALCALFLSGQAIAAPIGAKATYVSGDVSAFHLGETKSVPVVKGSTFAEGDKIKTSADGVVEVQMDNGNLIRLDKNGELIIKSLNRDESGSTFSIFGLTFGRVKSAVSKLVSNESKFEYHTKAAICGVGGTPPFVVEADADNTHVDLLGDPGDAGLVYVAGFDPDKKRVLLKPMTRTTVRAGEAPLDPFGIDDERLNFLNRVIPFYIGMTTQQPHDVALQSLVIKTTIAPPQNPASPGSMEKLDKQYGQSSGGANAGGGPGASQPPTQPVGIRINIK